VPGQYSADTVECSTDTRQEGDWIRIIISLTDVRTTVEDSVDLPVAVAVLPVAASLQPPAHAGSSLADFSTLKMEAIRSSETSGRSTIFLHGATSQKTTFFIVTAVKTSTLTNCYQYCQAHQDNVLVS
jgi:hypothetical protein